MKIDRFTKAVAALNGAVPVALLGWDAATDQLGANPVNFAIRTTGVLALVFLLLSLAVTPAARLTGAGWLGQFRRMLGLYAFFHTALHVALFVLFDRAADVADALYEVVARTYLTVGAVGFVLLVPLAVTSTDGAIRRLGPTRWRALHRLAYVAAVAGVVHFLMLVKADATRPLAFAAVLGGLLAYRFVSAVRRRPAAVPPTAPEPDRVTFARSGKSALAGGKTVLELAEDLGVAIDSNCRAGVCGSCRVKLIAGRVTMDADDALDAADRAGNVILSCQARCVGPVVVDA